MEPMQFDPLVARVSKGNPEVTGALLVDSGGRVVVSDGLGTQLATAAVALVMPLRDFLDRAAAELGCGALSAALIEGDAACFALADVDGDRTAIVLGRPGCSPGALRADALWLAEQVRMQSET
jgi:predicted regulator of Ras-like GTPase activity (Roadblock/LC7/MglB family)